MNIDKCYLLQSMSNKGHRNYRNLKVMRMKPINKTVK